MSYKNSDAHLYDVLAFIKDAGEPVGGGAVQKFLITKGYMMIESAVGRFLRDMDYLGLTIKRQ